MAIDVSKVDVWVAQISDRPGSLAEKLEALSAAGASLEFVVARRADDKPGTSKVFLAPLRGAPQTRAAKRAGFAKATGLHSIRVEAPDKPGLGAKMSRLLGDAGINVRGLSAAAIGRRSVAYFAFDADADANRAARILRAAK